MHLTMPQAIEKLQMLQIALDEAQNDYRDALDDLAEARSEMRRVHSALFIEADGPQDLRRKIADQESVSEYRDQEIAEARMWAAQSKVTVIRDQIAAMRTIISALRTEFMAEPTGQWS